MGKVGRAHHGPSRGRLWHLKGIDGNEFVRDVGFEGRDKIGHQYWVKRGDGSSVRPGEQGLLAAGVAVAADFGAGDGDLDAAVALDLVLELLEQAALELAHLTSAGKRCGCGRGGRGFRSSAGRRGCAASRARRSARGA